MVKFYDYLNLFTKLKTRRQNKIPFPPYKFTILKVYRVKKVSKGLKTPKKKIKQKDTWVFNTLLKRKRKL